ncbi:MAG: sarcosine oxidase subunit alpha [Pseudomonadota bacterium]
MASSQSQPNRLATGGRIDRNQPCHFTFNGEPLEGFAGDSLASALLANNKHLVARSFKYHRPRGIMGAGVEEPNAMVQLGYGAHTIPNLKATEIELHDGLEAESVNCWPSVSFDVSSINGLFSKFFPAGFYYKTFMPSQFLWMKVFEPIIRKAAGWGKAPSEPDPDSYDHRHVHCDVMVVGGGPAGLAAAREAAKSGARVILADEQPEFGGSLLSLNRTVDGLSGADWVAREVQKLEAASEVRLLPRTTVFGYYHHNYLCAVERRHDRYDQGSSSADPQMRLWHIRAKMVVLATGAHERPLVFADNDRPGIMLASAAQSYVNRYGVAPGRRAVLFTNNDGAYEAALDLKAAGVEVAEIVDVRQEATGTLPKEALEAGIKVSSNSAITAVKGKSRVAGVTLHKLGGNGQSVSGEGRQVACDLILMSGGWSPVVHLFCHTQGKMAFDEAKACFVPAKPREATLWAGAVGGSFDLAGALVEGVAQGRTAALAAGFEPTDGDSPVIASEEPDLGSLEARWVVPTVEPIGRSKAKHFVDYQNDSTAADIRLAAREGFDNVEHMKRYTLSGFGTDQGKTGNINALAILSDAVDRAIAETGTTTFRPPYTPVPFGVMAGRELGDWLDPKRVTAIQDWHEAQGASFEDVGQWKRPWFFPKAGEDIHAAVARECAAVRDTVGLLDASTLGKIDIQGPDAAEFLNRIYTNAWLKLKVGSIRYGLMCHEDGMIFDDGTTARLGENHFLMTTTTGGAATVMDWLEEYLQTEWPDLKVYCTSVTEQWSTVAVAGPKARTVLERVCSDIDLAPEAFPFMTFRDGTVAGSPARVSRISFTGELSYEVSVPWSHGKALWEALYEAGEEFGITPYGTETMHVLRAEKGFIIVGQETDGTVTPQDLGMDWIVSKAKKDFIGKRSFSRADTVRLDRKQLVGLLTEDPGFVLPEGAQIVIDPNAPTPIPMLGHVTSSYWSPAMGRSIALALIKGGRARKGDRLFAPLEDRTQAVTIVDPVFIDPEGKRRDG